MDVRILLGWTLIAVAACAGCGQPNAAPETAVTSPPQQLVPPPSAAKPLRSDNASPVAAPTVAPAAYVEPEPGLDTAWIPEECFGALMIHPRQLLEKQQFQGQTRIWLESAAADLGVALEDLEQVCFLLIPPEPEPHAPPTPVATAWVFRFATPTGQQGMLRRFLGEQHRQQEISDGRTYYKDPQAPVALGAPDARTIVFAPERILRKSLLEPPEWSPLLNQLKAVKGRPDIVGAVDAPPLRTLLRQAMAARDSGPLPSWVRSLADVARQTKRGILLVDFAHTPVAQLTLEAEDSQAAVRLEEMARGYRAGASLLLGAAKAQWVRGEDGHEFLPLFNLLNRTLAGVKTTREVRHVIVEAAAPEELVDLPQIVEAAFLAASRGAVRQERVRRLQLIGLAMHNYHVAKGSFPPGATYDAAGRPLLSWRVHLLPFLGEEQLYSQFRLDEPWDSPHNRTLISQIPVVYQSPGAEANGLTRFTTLVGEGTPFSLSRGPTLRDFTDGPSKTILVVECGPDRALPWTQPDTLPFDPLQPISSLGTIDPTGFLALFGDGRVELIKPQIEPASLKALLTHAGGEPRQAETEARR